MVVGPDAIGELLGRPKYRKQQVEEEPAVGLATGLAWTQTGGEILHTEVTLMPGKGKVTLTGQLGDVMQESAQAALSFVRSRSESLDLDPAIFAETDVHVHVPEGAIPKDGPSAGTAIAAALVSAFTKITVRQDVAMTGEITLRGRVLPVGGIKEKVLAAFRLGVREVILPEENEKDLEDIPAEVRDGMTFRCIDHMDTVLEHALTGAVAGQVANAASAEKMERAPSVAH
jgi:ATP-dependent Lon protease